MTITNIEDRPIKRKNIQIKHKRHKISMEKPIESINEEIPVVIEKSNAITCFVCKKKLRITTQHECRCGSVLCAKHRFEDQHTCNFDYRKNGTEKLQKENPSIYKHKLGNDT
ncbi:hypothetical protein GVAV_001474 [Gurleya vavrai]